MYKLGRFPLVYPDHKAVYFRVNKVATQSLTALFEKQIGPGVPGGDIGPNYFKFCFVRNPYDRLVSCWLNQIANPTPFSKKLFERGMHKGFWEHPGLKPGMEFSDFVKAIVKIDDLKMNPHFKPQYVFLIDKHTGGFMPDFVGRFECMRRDYEYICRAINIKPEKMPVRNKTGTRKPWQEYYNLEILRMVGHKYRKDFEMFGYSVFL